MNADISPLTTADAAAVADMQRAVARSSRLGLARSAEEISDDYIRGALDKAVAQGAAFGAWDAGRLLGSIHVLPMGPKIFDHVWTDLTVAVHPEAQGRGVGRALFQAVIAAAGMRNPSVTRIELFAGSTNTGAIRLYESLGFRQEGRFPGRVRYADGFVDDDIPMALILDGR